MFPIIFSTQFLSFFTVEIQQSEINGYSYKKKVRIFGDDDIDDIQFGLRNNKHFHTDKSHDSKKNLFINCQWKSFVILVTTLW